MSAEAQKHTVINEILPKAGLVYSEKGNLSEVLCKPKIMPLKSTTLQRIESIEKGGEAEGKLKEEAAKGPASAGGLGAGGNNDQSQGSGAAPGQSESMSFE